jgi:hypothetical protein
MRLFSSDGRAAVYSLGLIRDCGEYSGREKGMWSEEPELLQSGRIGEREGGDEA